MAKRYIGNAVITIEYVGETPDGRGNYAGTVRVGKHTWRFDELHSGVGGVSSGRGYGYPADSPEAYDEMAQSAVSFASYYTTHNRGDDAPEWAPPPEVADAIDEAVSIVLRGDGTYEVRRSPEGKVWEDAVMHEVSESSLVRDYEAVDHRGRVIGGPYKDYDRAKREAERARGHVRFAPSVREAAESEMMKVGSEKVAGEIAREKGLCWGWSVFGPGGWYVGTRIQLERIGVNADSMQCSGDRRTPSAPAPTRSAHRPPTGAKRRPR
jgi:hypothetical protein